MNDGCKVDRVADKYHLGDLDGRLQRRRCNKDASLRDLDEYINTRVLESAMISSGMDPVDGEAANYLSLLRSDDEISRKEARRELARQGVPVDDLEEDFVSYQTVRKHLNECMEIDTSKSYSPEPDEDRDRMGNLKGRTENVIRRTITRLRKHGAVRIGEPTAIVSMKVRCGTCGRTHDVSELLRQRACACADEE